MVAMPIRQFLVFPALVAAASCAPTRFVRSDSAFVEAPRAQLPEFFLEGAPERPWRSVGTIEVTLQGEVSEAKVIATALEAGQRAGCQLLSPAQKPRHSRARPPGIQFVSARVAHDHGDSPPPPPDREAPAARESAAAASTSSGASGSSERGGEGPASSGGGSSRMRRWRFDCGVYDPAASPQGAEAASVRAPPGA